MSPQSVQAQRSPVAPMQQQTAQVRAPQQPISTALPHISTVRQVNPLPAAPERVPQVSMSATPPRIASQASAVPPVARSSQVQAGVQAGVAAVPPRPVQVVPAQQAMSPKITVPQQQAPVVSATIGGQSKVEQRTEAPHAVVATKDPHPAVLPVQALRKASVSANPPVVTSAPRVVVANTNGVSAVPPPAVRMAPPLAQAQPAQSRPAMQAAPFLPPLSKAPRVEQQSSAVPASLASQSHAASPTTAAAPVQKATVVEPPVVKKLVPQSVPPAVMNPVSSLTAQVPPLPVGVPVPPPSPHIQPKVVSETHGTLPSRITGAPVAAVEESHIPKQPLSQVFPSKQEVVDGAHDELVKNGTLPQEGNAGAEERATNYIDTRLEDENLFGGMNKGSTQVVWGMLKDMDVDVVLTGDLPTEEMSRDEHVSHELHEKAYLMVRDVAKKLSLAPKAGETTWAYLVRAAEAGPLF